MNCKKIFGLLAVVGLASGTSTTILGETPSGSVRLGYVVLDEEGSQAVNQPTFNLYEGAALSLENFSYKLDNGTRFFGDFRNLTLNNRRLSAGVTRAGKYGLTLRNNQYRRTYGGDGSRFTRRRTSSTDFWVQPHKYIRLFGGLGQTVKHGTMIDLFEPFDSQALTPIDYTQNYAKAGLRFKQGSRRAELEYWALEFTDDLASANERSSRRFRVTASTPVPGYDRLRISGGFQHFNYTVKNRLDTLTANTAWTGLHFHTASGFSLRYSIVMDRTGRTSDLVATDNISNGFYAGKSWARQGGVTVGYRHRINDDVSDDVTHKGIVFSGWLKPLPALTIKTGYGSENKVVNNGRTLTGDIDYTRFSASVQYAFAAGSRARIKYASRNTENEQIGSSADYLRLGGDIWVQAKHLGDLQVSYAYLDGEYDNSGGSFRFKDYVLSGDLMPIAQRGFQVGFGGTYVRSKEDLDVESFSVRLTGSYTLPKGHRLELKYAAHNFDNFADSSPIYSEFYTANVVEIYLVKDF